MELLRVKGLKMYYKTLRGYVKAVDDINLYVNKGEALGLAGESGCGKTSVVLTILRILPSNSEILDGKIIFDGENLLEMDETSFRKKIRWKRISMIFQGAMNALHPCKTVGNQIVEPIMIHEKIGKNEAKERAMKLLDLVGVGSEKYDRYPHELSGGMKQRAVIAMALACSPDLLIADEPTTALDVITQAQILKFMRELRRKMNLSMILITHDLSIITEICDKIAIMYAGKIVELGFIEQVFENQLHPYTRLLISAFPSILGEKRELSTIPGFPPNLLNPPSGCRFHPRCPYIMEICKRNTPKLLETENNHYVACHLRYR